jgi:hypothetical protein
LAQVSPAWQVPFPHTTSVTHVPLTQLLPVAQVPQLPPQPFEPHCLPLHCGLQH